MTRSRHYYRYRTGGIVTGFIVGGLGAGVFWAVCVWFGSWLGTVLAGGSPEYVRLYGKAVAP